MSVSPHYTKTWSGPMYLDGGKKMRRLEPSRSDCLIVRRDAVTTLFRLVC